MSDSAGRPRALRPGEIRLAADVHVLNAGRETRALRVRSESDRVVRVSSHYPFERVNRRLVFDRTAAVGFHLDLPAGASERWLPGEAREVRLVRYGGRGAEGETAMRAETREADRVAGG